MMRLAFIALALTTACLQAAEPVFREDFATYGEGEKPLLPPDGNSFAWRFEDGWSAEVEREDARNYLKVRRPTGLPYATFGRGFEAKEGTRSLSMRMNFRLPAGAEPSDYFLMLGHYETNRHAGPLKVRIHNYRLSVYHGIEGAAKMAPEPLIPDMWYTLVATLDYGSQQLQVHLLRENDAAEVFATGSVPFTMPSPPCNTLLIRPQESREPSQGALEWDLADLVIETES